MATTNIIARRFEEQSLLSGRVPMGPFLPQHIATAFQPWSFKAVPFSKYTNDGLYRLLHVLPRIALPPDKALEALAPTNRTQMWKRERSLDRDLLPIYYDLRFRLQHNGLRLRKKYRFHPTAVACIFGCLAVESAKHLFWDCPLAYHIWTNTL